MPGWIERDPRLMEETMAVAGEVRRQNYDLPPGLQNSLALTQQLDGIRDMLDDMTQRDHIHRNLGEPRVAQAGRNQAQWMFFPGHAGSRGIGLDAGNFPACRSHHGEKTAVAAAYIEQLPFAYRIEAHGAQTSLLPPGWDPAQGRPSPFPNPTRCDVVEAGQGGAQAPIQTLSPIRESFLLP